MAGREHSVERLRAALRRLAAEDVDELVAQARDEARATVRSALTDALTEAMFESAERRLAETRPESRRHRPVGTAEPAREQASPPMPRAELLCYVYGVISSATVPTVDGLAGIEIHHPVRVLAEGALAAVVSDVAGSDFSEEQLRAHLEDLQWVETVARRHEAVLDELTKRTTTIPMRMCTVYRTEDGVREMLRREAQPLQQALEQLAGKAEWGVKVFFDRHQARAETEPQPAPVSETSGASYMESRRRARDLDHEVDRACSEIHEQLGALASESALNPPHRPNPSVDRGEMVMNGVYLLQNELIEAFHDRVRDLASTFAGLGLALVPTGPWPPYNFLPAQTGATW